MQDSNGVHLPSPLTKKFPVTRSRKLAAGLKGGPLVSVCASGPKSVALVGERTADIWALRLGPWVRGRILLADQGYYSHRPFAKIAEHGGFFVRRLRKNADPLFVRSNTVHGGRAIRLEGKHLSEVLPHLDDGILDAEAESTHRKRGYNGQRVSDTFTCRRVAVWHEKARRYHTYVNNIGPERLSVEDVATPYSLRWEIDLTLKGTKSSYALDTFKRKNEYVIQALIWAAPLTLVESRGLQNELKKSARPGHRARYTPLRWGRAFRGTAAHVLTPLVAYLGLGPSEGEARAAFPRTNRALTRPSLDSHVSRHRFREEWSG
jgi:putative transposase